MIWKRERNVINFKFYRITDHGLDVLKTEATNANASEKLAQFLRPFNQILNSSHRLKFKSIKQ